MKQIKQENGSSCHFHEELFSLVMDAIAPWAFSDKNNSGNENWRIRAISGNDKQVRICVMHVTRRDQYTALICCHDEPEILAVSFTSGNLGMLNPYLDNGHKLEADLDGLGCWNVFSATFSAEPGAEAVRYLRAGKIEEVRVNEFNAFAIIDWDSSQHIDEYLGVKVDGVWKKPVVAAMPYSIDYVVTCWRNAVNHNNGMRSRWNRWITSAFVELCGADREVLQREMMNGLTDEKNQACFHAFKQERRKFLAREKQPLDNLLLNA